jgi:phage repressor protein C with HTH and peptisase S24 domain
LSQDTVIQAILDEIQRHGSEAPVASVISAVARRTDSKPRTIRNEISRLKKSGVIFSPSRGLYSLQDASPPPGTPAQTASVLTHEPVDLDPEATDFETDYVRIDTVAVEASAGGGAEVDFEIVTDHTYLPRWYVQEVIGAQPGQEVKRIRVTGNSMEPTLRPGDHVYCVLFEPGQEPVDGTVCFIRCPYGLIVKRLRFSVDSQGDGQPRYQVTLVSDNPEYPEDTLPLDVFRRDFFPVGYLGSSERPL